MHFVQYQPLKDQLKSRTLTERQSLPYLVAWSCSSALLFGYITWTSATIPTCYHLTDFVLDALTIGLAIAGVLYSYSKNGANSGFDFIKKYVVLGWVVSVRCILFLIPLLVIYILGVSVLGETESDTSCTTWADVAVFFFVEVAIYQRIGRHIADTA